MCYFFVIQLIENRYFVAYFELLYYLSTQIEI